MQDNGLSPKQKVLFVCYGGGHFAIVNAIVKAIAANHPEIECVVLALTLAYKSAENAGLRPLGYRDLLHVTDQAAARAHGRRIILSNGSPDVSRDETIAYLGANYFDLVEQMGNKQAAAHYAAHGRFGFYPINFMRRVLKFLNPSLVVTTNSPRSEKAAIEAARDLGIPSLAVLDLFALPSSEFATRKVRANLTCVLADPVKAQLLELGFAEQEVAITGNPAFDGLFSADTIAKASAFVAARNWEGKKIILWAGHKEPATHPSLDVPAGHEYPIMVESTLRRFAAENPDYALVVRYHPGEWHTFPKQPDTENIYFSVPSAEPVQPIVLASQIVVVQTSTVGLEASVAGKRVISMESSPHTKIAFSLSDLGVAEGCPQIEDLPNLIKNNSGVVRNSPYTRGEEKAAIKVVEEIRRLLGVRGSV